MYTMYMRMVRKQLHIEERQDKALKRRAKKLGISEAEVVRAALDAALARESAPQEPPPSLPADDPLAQLLKRAEEDVKRGCTFGPDAFRREGRIGEREERLMKRIDASRETAAAAQK
jgi:hypothetical protein